MRQFLLLSVAACLGLCLGQAPLCPSSSCWSSPPYPDGSVLRALAVAPGTVRLTTIPRGAPAGPFSPVDLTLPQPQPAPRLNLDGTTDAAFQLSTPELVLTVSKSSPVANVTRKADGALLSAEQAAPSLTSGAACGDASSGGPMAGGRWPGCDACCLRATRSLQPGEQLFGGGVQMYSGPGQRGKALFLQTNAIVGQYPGWSHVVAPFFLSSRGYGILLNTHGYSYWDIGKTVPGVPSTPPATACGTAYADPASGRATGSVSLSCPGSPAWKIASVQFASYGLPTGACGSFRPETKHCGQVNLTAKVAALCIGKASCTVGPVSNAFAGSDPCPGNNQKRLSVSVVCAGPGPTPPPPPAGPGSVLIASPDPVVDLFFFAGPSFHSILEQYSGLTGRMSLPPKWALGLWYHPKEDNNQTGVLQLVSHFERANVKLSALTLEPPWQTHSYSCTYVWNPGNFWDPDGFIANLTGRGVKLTLWEHGYVYNSTGSPLYEPLLEENCAADWMTWQGLTPDFTLNRTRAAFAAYHTKTFVQAGVAGFKLDECDGNPGAYDPGSRSTKRWFFPDNSSFPSGLNGAQVHNLFGMYYAKTFHDMFEAAGMRTFLKARANYVGGQARPTTFYSDSYDLPNYLLGVVNSGFGGWVFAPEVRLSKSDSDFARRAQLMLFSALASMDAWNTGFTPWEPDVSAANAAMFQRLAAERSRLETFLYSAYYRQSRTGVSVARALVVDFEADPGCFGVADQFLLGDGLMVAPAPVNASQRDVYFPAGANWTDYWRTNKTVLAGGGTEAISTPDDTIAIFQRVGSVIPLLTKTTGRDGGGGHLLTLRFDASASSASAASARTVVYDDDGITASGAIGFGYFAMDVETAYTGDGTGGAVMWRTSRRESGSKVWQPSWRQLQFEAIGASVKKWSAVACKGDWPALSLLGQEGDRDDRWREIPHLILDRNASTDLRVSLSQQNAPVWTVMTTAGDGLVKAVVAIPFSTHGNALECKPIVNREVL